jgi:hypothetical protein
MEDDGADGVDDDDDAVADAVADESQHCLRAHTAPVSARAVRGRCLAVRRCG